MKTQTLTKTARRILLAAAVSTTVLTASAAGNWTGGGADTKWSTPENWNSEAVPTSGDIRFWEPQDFVLLTWPNETTDWAPYLEEIRQTVAEMVRAIARHEEVMLL